MRLNSGSWVRTLAYWLAAVAFVVIASAGESFL